jgi:flagellar basal-body rod protein FlgG
MIRAFHTGRTGAAEHQKMMAIAANNMANANTDGFKASTATFQELLHQRVRLPDDYENRREGYDAANAFNTKNWNNGAPPQIFDEEGEPIFRSYPGNYFTENKLRVGIGSRLSENAMVMTFGNFISTGDPLTAALADSRAFFAVMSNIDGEIAYTRNGTFNLSNEEDGLYLVNTNGEYVLDENYEFIRFPDDMTRDDIILAAHGALEQPGMLRLGVFTFDNIYALAHIGGNKYMPNELSGEAELVALPSDDVVRQYHVEASNVSIADEMIKVIQAQRAFQSNLTTIRTADEIEAYVNQLKGL